MARALTWQDAVKESPVKIMVIRNTQNTGKPRAGTI